MTQADQRLAGSTQPNHWGWADWDYMYMRVEEHRCEKSVAAQTQVKKINQYNHRKAESETRG